MLRAKALRQQIIFKNKACFFLHFNREARKGRLFILENFLEKQLDIPAVKVSILIFAFALLLTNCKSETAPKQTNAPTREFTDDLGRTIKLPQKVERAISLAPNLTENIFAVGAGDRLVGVTTFCNYPPAAEKIQKVSDTQTPNMETIVALKPDVVFVSTASQLENFTKILDERNIAVFVTNPNSFEDVFKNLKTFGEIFDRDEQAENLVIELKQRVANIEKELAGKSSVKVFVQIDKDSLYTVGKESFITDLIERAGGESVTKTVATAYPKISKETALALNPDVIILSESPNNLEPNEVFKNSNAVKNGKVFKINADIISRPSPRLVDALEQIAAYLHAESF
ncbi:ABC transporter substrate-binding protein [soil metagenome]